jgi:hypothetical protein
VDTNAGTGSKRVVFDTGYEVGGEAAHASGSGVGAGAGAGAVTGSKQVFDVREEPGKARECVILWDEATRVSLLSTHRFAIDGVPSSYALE